MRKQPAIRHMREMEGIIHGLWSGGGLAAIAGICKSYFPDEISLLHHQANSCERENHLARVRMSKILFTAGVWLILTKNAGLLYICHWYDDDMQDLLRILQKMCRMKGSGGVGLFNSDSRHLKHRGYINVSRI